MSDRGRSPAPSGGLGLSQRSSQSPHGSAGSRGSSPSRSAAGTQGLALAPPQGAAGGWKSGMGFDPAKSANKEDKGNTRMELPPDAYVTDTQKSKFTLRGNKFNTEGKPATVQVNQYRMKTFDFTKKIYQYDVTISPASEKKQVVLKKLWVHETTKRALAKYNYPLWIFDGRKLAWAAVLVDRGELRFTVDLDDGKRPPGAPAREGNKFLVMIRQTTQINVSTLQLYLDQKTSFGTDVEQAMNFIDHLIRQYPSQQMLSLKRNFYDENERGKPLAGGCNVVEVHKGVYASVRLSHNLTRGGIGLALNADVASTCFWTGRNTMDVVMLNFLATCDPKRWYGLTQVTVANHLRPVQHHSGNWSSSDAFKQLRKLVRLKFTVNHAGRREKGQVYSIRGFTFDNKYGAEGANAKTVTFEYNGKEICVAEYYGEKYKAWLKYARLPLIDAGKGGYIPMEYAILEPMQRYPFKLNPDQTAAMIKIAVTRPQVRRADIENKVAKLQHRDDPYLRQYGVSFEPTFTKTDAKILPPPKVDFGQGSGSADPRFSGRWDLRGKKFWKQNMAPLQNWAFIVMDTCVDFPNLQNFAKTFRQTFLGHGGKCPQDAILLNVPANIKHDIAEAMAWAHGEVRKLRGYTQLLFVVVGHKNSPHYIRLKKSADCRFGILSQVIQSDAVKRNSGQYHSNVCMKVNAKLGGATSRTMAPWKSQPTYFPKDRPTMIVGVDISHAAPGGTAPSVAAMTMSVDRDATRYAAMVETNGYRTEMLLPTNCHFLFGQLCKQWMAGHDNAFPKHVIYFRDGVSEGQFAQVIDQEIAEIKRYFKGAAPKLEPPKFTVIVATKRHHIRIFPQNGDKNGNALPGTLVEKEVTHPFMWDFYLCSHVAIQGTARPVHYHVISDEMNVPVNDFQKMIYHQCYSYARSTTPVSLHPAVYYAHLAGNRARAHENVATSDGFRAGGKGHELIRDKIAKGQSVGTMPGKDDDSPPLLQLGGKPTGEGGPVDGEMRQREFFRGTMWYI